MSHQARDGRVPEWPLREAPTAFREMRPYSFSRKRPSIHDTLAKAIVNRNSFHSALLPRRPIRDLGLSVEMLAIATSFLSGDSGAAESNEQLFCRRCHVTRPSSRRK